ncbi:Uncharacterised protein [Mycobacterium tuberculosis]|nr:Uncharacterised protein [Mycobacterium tuberculosis]
MRTVLKSLSSPILNGIRLSCSSVGTSFRSFAEANILRMASSDIGLAVSSRTCAMM